MNYPYPPWQPPPPPGPHPTGILGLLAAGASFFVLPVILGTAAILLALLGIALSGTRARNAGAGLGMTTIALATVSIVWTIIQLRL